MNDIEILEKYIDLIKKGYCDDCNELNCIDNYPHRQIAQAIENILKERQADKEKIKELETINKMQEYRINEMDIPKSLVEEEINRLKYDVSKIKEIKQTRYSDYDRIRLSAYVTKSNEIIKRLEKCVNKR